MRIKEIIQKSVVLIAIMTVLCGVIYPLSITGIAQLFFHDQANGSIIEVDGIKYGSALLGQQFTKEQYLWGRSMNLNTGLFSDEERKALLYAGPSNISTASEEYKQQVKDRVDRIISSNPDAGTKQIPVDLVTGSGSGLDPQISYAAALYQVQRIAGSRNITPDQVTNIIDQYTTNRFVGIFGEKVVNVLQVNLALDGILK